MRLRFTSLFALAAAFASIVGPSAGAATTTISTTFHETFGRAAAHPCAIGPTLYTCGEGLVPGFGPATSTLTITSFTNFDPETACGDTTLLRRITLVSSAGTLELAERGTVCFPGASFFTPGASSGHSYGNPVRLDLTWTVSGGTGVFGGASGSGSDSVKTAGDTGRSNLSGTITLP